MDVRIWKYWTEKHVAEVDAGVNGLHDMPDEQPGDSLEEWEGSNEQASQAERQAILSNELGGIIMGHEVAPSQPVPRSRQADEVRWLTTAELRAHIQAKVSM